MGPLEHPQAYKMGCLLPTPIRVDRVIEEGETFVWEEYSFRAFRTPGHTEYHVSIVFEVDGYTAAIVGDVVNVRGLDEGRVGGPAPSSHTNEFELVSNSIFRNHVRPDAFRVTAAVHEKVRADLICGGHWSYRWVEDRHWEGFAAWCRAEEAWWRDLLEPDDLGPGVWSDFISAFPYLLAAAPGETAEFELRFENPFLSAGCLAWSLDLSPGWTADPSCGELSGALGERTAARICLRPPADADVRLRQTPVMISASFEGRALGQPAEVLVDLDPQQDWGWPGGRRPNPFERLPQRQPRRTWRPGEDQLPSTVL